MSTKFKPSCTGLIVKVRTQESGLSCSYGVWSTVCPETGTWMLILLEVDISFFSFLYKKKRSVAINLCFHNTWTAYALFARDILQRLHSLPWDLYKMFSGQQVHFCFVMLRFFFPQRLLPYIDCSFSFFLWSDLNDSWVLVWLLILVCTVYSLSTVTLWIFRSKILCLHGFKKLGSLLTLKELSDVQQVN